MTDTFFPTSTPAMEHDAQVSDRDFHAEITNLTAQVDRAINMREHWERKHNELQQKIANVKGYIFDLYSMNGDVDDEIKEIAELLDITLTKRISGTATFEISWSAQVPLGFDAEDFEISFDVDCETYEAEDFDWQEENTEVNGEDDY